MQESKVVAHARMLFSLRGTSITARKCVSEQPPLPTSRRSAARDAPMNRSKLWLPASPHLRCRCVFVRVRVWKSRMGHPSPKIPRALGITSKLPSLDSSDSWVGRQ